MFDETPSPKLSTGGPGEARAVSEAEARFESCRWHARAEDQLPAHCTHRDVLPMAGTHGFVIDAWCSDCSLYKLRRTPRKNGIS
jgi:hypothetical protein